MSLNKEPVGDIISKLVYAGIGILLASSIVPVGLSFFGTVLCSSCDSLTSTFIMVVLPFALVLTVLYFILLKFVR